MEGPGMDMFVVHGGRRLRGRVRVSGAKNSALPIMAAVLASERPTTLHGVPELVDVTTLCQLLTALGVEATRDGLPVPILPENGERPAVESAPLAEGVPHTNGSHVSNGASM